MTDEKKNITRSLSNATSFHDPAQIRKQAEQKAKDMHNPDLNAMTHKEIRQMVHEIQVKQLEMEMQVEHLQSRLKESADQNEILTTVTENMLDLVSLADIEGNLKFVGKSHEIFGYELESLTAKNVMDFVHPEDLPRVLEVYKELVASGAPHRIAYRCRCRDGSYLWIETRGTFLKDENNNPQGIILSSRDITERRIAEQQLRESKEAAVQNERHYRLLFEQSPLGVFHVDENGVIVSCNDNFVKIIGSSREALVGLDMKKLPDQKLVKELRKALAGSNAFYEDTYHSVTAKKSTPVKVYFSPLIIEEGTIIGCTGIVEDITEQKRSEEALRQSENHYRAIFETSGTAMFIIEEDTTISLVNDNFGALSGYSKPEIEGKKSWTEFVHPDDVAWMKENHYLRRQNPDAAPRQYEFRFITRHEEMRHILLSVDMIPESDQSTASGIDITERRRAEEALQANYELLQIAGETAKFGGWTVDLENNICTWSDVVADIHEVPHGYAPPVEEGISFYAPEWREKITQVFSACAKKGIPYDEEMEIITKTGKRVWVRTACKAVKDEKGKIIKVQGSFQDITYHKQTEQKLVEQKDMLTAIYRNAPLVMMVVNSERRIQQVNGFAAQFAGRDVEEMLGMRGGEALRCLHVLDDPKGCGFGEYCQQCVIRNLVLDTLETGETHLQIEAPYYFKGEDNKIQEMAFLSSSTPIMVKGARMVLMTLQDITERKQAEQQLRESKEKYRMLVENLTEVIYSLDETGRITYVSPAVELTSGYTPSELLGKPFVDFVYPDDRERRLKPFHEILSGIDGASEYRFVTKDNQVIWVRTTARPLLKEGRVTGLQGVLVDITERKKAEQERDKLQAQLQQAQKMESVGRLAGGVAHDFNNMLTIINGYAEMMTGVLSPSDPMHESAREIHDAGKRSAVIVRKLLAFARKQTIAPVTMNLNDSVSNMLKMLQRLIGENIDLLWKPGKDLWLVKMDFSQIDQILANLVVNARDAIADVGKITIETEKIEFDDEYCKLHAGFLPGKYVMLAVSDNGCGMDKDVLENLFEPFFTTKEVGQGTGLGLPTVYGIVKQNNGFINVYSEPGQGTTVRIYLPRYMDDGAKPDQDKGEKDATPGHGETILVLEDEAVVLNLTRIMLENLGYKVLAASSPNEAMKIAKDHGGKIDLLITDVVMPEMNGREFASQINTLDPDIKVLFMSGYTANVVAHHGVLDEGVQFIQKPFSLKDMAVKVREALEQE